MPEKKLSFDEESLDIVGIAHEEGVEIPEPVVIDQLPNKSFLVETGLSVLRPELDDLGFALDPYGMDFLDQKEVDRSAAAEERQEQEEAIMRLEDGGEDDQNDWKEEAPVAEKDDLESTTERSVTVSRLELTKTLVHALRYLAEHPDEARIATEGRPKKRIDCRDGFRPCPFVGCKWHLFIDVKPDGAIIFNFPSLVPNMDLEKMRETCALDVAEKGGLVLEDVGKLIGLTRERIRQEGRSILGALWRVPTLRDLLSDYLFAYDLKGATEPLKGGWSKTTSPDGGSAKIVKRMKLKAVERGDNKPSKGLLENFDMGLFKGSFVSDSDELGLDFSLGGEF